MEIFGYTKTCLDITIIFGYQYIGARIYGYRNDASGNAFLGPVKQDGRVTMPLTVLGKFDGLKIDDKKFELMEDK